MRTDEEEWARKTTGSEDMASQEVAGRGTHVPHAVHGQHDVGVRDDGAGTRQGETATPKGVWSGVEAVVVDVDGNIRCAASPVPGRQRRMGRTRMRRAGGFSLVSS
jgi:hypothetical protein